MSQSKSIWDGISGPGPQEFQYGDERLGYFGAMTPAEFITYSDFFTLTGVLAGSVLTATILWQKMIIDGKVVFFPLSSIKSNISWQALSNYNVISGQKVVQIQGFDFKVRLFRGITGDLIDPNGNTKALNSEWDRLTSPLLKTGFNSIYPSWKIYTQQELGTNLNGRSVYVQERTALDAIIYRGQPEALSLGTSGSGSTTSSGPYSGWKPILELVK